MRAYVFREVMLCRSKCHARSCVGGVHVFMMAYNAICSVLLEDISYSRTCLLEDMYYRSACLTVQVVSLEYMFYRRAYFSG